MSYKLVVKFKGDENETVLDRRFRFHHQATNFYIDEVRPAASFVRVYNDRRLFNFTQLAVAIAGLIMIGLFVWSKL